MRGGDAARGPLGGGETSRRGDTPAPGGVVAGADREISEAAVPGAKCGVEMSDTGFARQAGVSPAARQAPAEDLEQAQSSPDADTDEQPSPSDDGDALAPRRRQLPPCRTLGVSWTDVTFETRMARRRPGLFGVPPFSDCLNAFDALSRRGSLKTILSGVSGEVHPGDMVALMGTSGAGKSTLLNILSRYLRETSGQVKYGGSPIDLKAAKKLSCLIQQEDLFNGFITVREHLYCMARLRTNVKKDELDAFITHILVTFGLSKIADSCIGNLQMGAKRGISGGEKKRLSIATEILTNPSIIFADEPTTGLDSFIAESVMSVFEYLAQNGRSIICTIHQPSTHVFDKFNKVMLLAEGRVVFFGDRLALPVYLARLGKHIPPYTSVSDFIIDVLSSSDGEQATLELAKQMEAAWKQTGEPFMRDWNESLREKYLLKLHSEGLADKLGSIKSEVVRAATRKEGQEAQFVEDQTPLKQEEVPAPVRISWWTQFTVLLHRCALANKRNPQILQARIGQTLVSALLLGFIFFRLEKDVAVSKNGAANFINLNQGMTGLVAVLQTFTNDKMVAVREYRAGTYGLVPYFLAKTTSDILFQVFNPVVFLTIVWFMMGLNDSASRWLLGVAFIFLQTNASISLGYLISCLCPNTELALAVMPLVMMPLILVAGFMIILDTLPRFWVWVPYISPFRWAFSGVMHAIWKDVELPPCPDGLRPPSCYESGAEVLQYYCLDGDHMWENALILIALVFGYRALGLLALIVLNRRN
ncbi:ATP-binding cassette G family transporter ABCG84 [Besnoitia besnoiti]|uniref:ATP-binding cassette G family transporter ABCG84 n=1 Tax=Besnoitia besnoiti TaxID=94643 RepID=A0A2A9M868_BESBE|nr:ATP-binding cassette G family transporter ABCG84 [Besnoitia besnoiti]PFH32116.1 ATP-binding cassette G family transporter ABCG84 [Besnoitia besnoiti]